MTDLTWILDPATGDLVAEGLAAEETTALAGDLLPPGRELACARPLASAPLPAATDTSAPGLRVARIYHGSAIEGPGRRSVLLLQGCVTRCQLCAVPERHDISSGVALGVPDVVAALLDPAGEPRDGISVSGGEPFLQPAGLAALLRALKERGVHSLVYSGYTFETLARGLQSEVQEVLELADLLIDGPFVAALTEGAGSWTGSANQRVIDLRATRQHGQVMLWRESTIWTTDSSLARP